MHFVDYGHIKGVIYIISFFIFVDLLPLAEVITNLQIIGCVFSHDLSFENGSMISLTNDARKRWHEHCNGFSIVIGCL